MSTVVTWNAKKGARQNIHTTEMPVLKKYHHSLFSEISSVSLGHLINEPKCVILSAENLKKRISITFSNLYFNGNNMNEKTRKLLFNMVYIYLNLFYNQ